MSTEVQFTKDNIDKYLNILAKEYKRRNRKSKQVELILVGGASVIINYGFRDMTTDIDAIFLSDSIMKEAIYAVAEKEGLPDDWLNADFKRSNSFSDKLVQHSEYYRTFANIMEVRTIKGEFLIAMKLVAGRNYKRDLSDIAGIVLACRNAGQPVSVDGIDVAMSELYGGWDRVEEYTRNLLYEVIHSDDLEAIYNDVQEEENRNKEIRITDLKRRRSENDN